MPAKLYILIRTDIPLGDQGAQMCHATAEWCKRWQCRSGTEWDNETIVIVSVKDLPHLVLLQRKMEHKFVDYTIFCEPDLQGQMTSIACWMNSNIFSNLPLWPEKA